MSDETKRETKVIEQPDSNTRRDFLRRGGVLEFLYQMPLLPAA